MPANAALPHPDPLRRVAYDAGRLVAEFPPVLHNANKQAVFEIACPDGCTHGGELVYTRWPAFELPERLDPGVVLERVRARPGIYDYVPEDVAGAVEWHVNFADPRLFFGYGTDLFAQDEMMTAEHPVLGSLVEALRASAYRGLTDEAEGPTPVLVTGAERRCRVATGEDEAQGRPRGLYGNAFGLAPQDAVRRATTRIDPPTVTNIIAMAAPSYRQGRYTRAQIERVLVTAYTGFAAAAVESVRLGGEGAPVVVHTGFWGCGAFGGNRVLMSMLQLVAASAAGVDRLVFHTASEECAPQFAEGLSRVRDELAPDGEQLTSAIVDRIDAMAFDWGTSDGN